MNRGWLSGSQSRVAIVVVTCTFIAASITAYQVYEAVCAQEEATQQALRSHARFAGWTFAREASEEMERGARRVLESVRARAMVAPTLPSSRLVANALADTRDCACVTVPEAAFVFRLDLRDRSIDACGTAGAPSAAERAWIADTVSRLAGSRRAAAGDPIFVSHARHDGVTLVFTALVSDEGVAYAAYGFAFDARAAGRTVFPVVFARRPLLPPATLATLPQDSALTLSVGNTGFKSGTALFASRERRSTGPSVETAMSGPFAGLAVRTAMRPAFRARVAVGSWTWNRSQFVLGLITITSGLIVISILQLHRERQMARLRGEFVSNVSHELRTPLAQIRMFAEMLRLGWVRTEDERRRSVQVIDQEARRLTHLVENILFYSRSERSATRVSVEPIDLASLVDEVVDGFRALSSTRAMTVRTEHAQGTATALADRDAMRQTLLNLLDNAVKYGPPGQTITVRTGGDAARSTVLVMVDDQGPGIDPRDRTRIWEPFRRLDRAVNAGVTGNGIGLAVVRELIRAQGGEVSVTQAPGGDGGARFVIALRGVELERRESGPARAGVRGLGVGAKEREVVAPAMPLWGDPNP